MPDSFRYILPEIAQPHTVTQTTPTPFPTACPACGRGIIGEVNYPAIDYRRMAKYACGATYTNKPQIQNHTEKWWGTCERSREVEQ